MKHQLPCWRDPEGQLTAAECKLPEELQYIRITIVDAQGRRAWTNPIFLR